MTLAKIRQSEAMSRFATGDTTAAIELLLEAQSSTLKWGVPYDQAHSLLDMAVLRRAIHEPWEMMAALEEARHVIAHHQFGLLEQLYPDSTQPRRPGFVPGSSRSQLAMPLEPHGRRTGLARYRSPPPIHCLAAKTGPRAVLPTTPTS